VHHQRNPWRAGTVKQHNAGSCCVLLGTGTCRCERPLMHHGMQTHAMWHLFTSTRYASGGNPWQQKLHTQWCMQPLLTRQAFVMTMLCAGVCGRSHAVTTLL
jgi:hypothetical protein